MGQKIRPSGLRLGVIRGWQSTWYADKEYREFLQEDIRIRRHIEGQFRTAGVTDVRIERRVGDAVRVSFGTSKPGIVIGRGGAGVEALKHKLEKLTGRRVHVNVQEIRTPELNADLTADAVASSIERRVSFRRAMRQAVQRTMKMGAKGIKVVVSGRLGGADIARSESFKEGSIPLHTIRADIDYGVRTARTKQGPIGVKVWVYRGDVLAQPKRRRGEDSEEKRGRVRARMADEGATEAQAAVQAPAPAPVAQAPEAPAPVAAPEPRPEPQPEVEPAADGGGQDEE
jgi:small subunit ribosomal protein S3